MHTYDKGLGFRVLSHSGIKVFIASFLYGF